jgi:alpha-amylase
MNRTICIYFQIHQPFRLKRYRFFDIGNDPYYYDDFTNESITERIAENSYIPGLSLLYDLIEKNHGGFKICFSVTGLALEHFRLYAPGVIALLQKLAKTGCVEFLAETYAHSLASIANKSEFIRQINLHTETIEKLFGLKPTVFRNTELIYSDEIGAIVSELGFEAIITEGAKHILGWRSPNFVYHHAQNSNLKLLLRNFKLSDDIGFRFANTDWNEYPLTAQKFIDWISNHPKNEHVFNIFLDFETIGEHHKRSTGIFDFIEALPKIAAKQKVSFATPSMVAKSNMPVSAIHAPYPISWADEERDLTAWTGNEMQKEALSRLYDLKPFFENITNDNILKNWLYLQCSDHFYYMSTKFFSDGQVHAYFNPYPSPYDAFMNYMNVLSDFEKRVKEFKREEPELYINRLEKELEAAKNELIKLKKEAEKRVSKNIKAQKPI